MKEKWVVAAKKADFAGIGKKYHIDPVVARLIRNRDIVEEKDLELYLYGSLSDLPSPELLKGMNETCSVLKTRIDQKKKIRIIGDYDIDGVSSTYILLKGLKILGAEADVCLPDRVADGYGMHRNLIDSALKDGIDTILTCDNGIAAMDEISYARQNGMTVLVTDHHEIPFTDADGVRRYLLPEADCIIDPLQPGCEYPFKNICGAVVAYKLIQALYKRYGRKDFDEEDYLELAAFATVGDVMELKGENRILVREGLKRLSRTRNVGLRSLIRECKLEGRELTAYHIGFILGPCINASGRLSTARKSLALLCESSPDRAALLSRELAELNDQRKAMTENGKEEACDLVDHTDAGKDRVLVIFLPSVHESVAGIIAGRLREKYNRPVFVITRGEKFLKGSGRSIEAYSMFEEMTKCADIFEQFGGHPMAAGLSIKEEKLDELRSRLNRNCTLTEEQLTPKIVIDVAMPVSYISKDLIRQLSILEPFGKGNQKPLFADRNLHVVWPRVLGKNRNVVRMILRNEQGFEIDALYFGEIMEFLNYTQTHERISVTYYPEINSYRGTETIQIVIQNYC